MSRLFAYKSTLTKWGLQENPFRIIPPEDPQKLAQIFYGRDQALELAIPALYEGRNVLVRGAWGIGKTALILNLIYKLQQEVAELGETMLVLYISSFPGETVTDFYRALLLAVADRLAEYDEEAKDICNTFLGFSIQRSKTTTEGKVSLWMGSLTRRQESPSSDVTPTANADPYPLLIRLLNKAENIYSRLVIAVDDLDKKDTPIVQTILENSLDLFRKGERRGFIMTGRGFTDLQEATLRALGIFSEDIPLEPMKKEDLRQIAINYLNSAKETPQNMPHPFTEDVMDIITTYAQGIPRQLNTICEKVLRKAATAEYETIDMTAFQTVWQTIQEDLANSLHSSPDIRRLLYVAYQSGGITEDIEDRYLNQLDAVTFIELIPYLKTAEDQGFMIRQDTAEGHRYLPSQLINPKLLPESQSKNEV